MAFRRKARSTRRPMRSRRTYKPTIRRTVKRMINRQTETKCWITAGTEGDIPITVGGTVLFPLRPPQGTGKFARIGNKVTPVGLDIRGHCNINSGGVYNVRLMLIKKQSPLDTFTTNGFENAAGNYGPASNTLGDIYARINTDRYTMLWNKVLTLGGGSSQDTGLPFCKLFKKYVKMNYPVQFDEGVTDPVRGQTELVVICRAAGNDSVSGSAEINYNMKFYFKDA